MSLSCPNLRKVVNVSTTALKLDTYGNIGQVSALPLHPSQWSGDCILYQDLILDQYILKS